MSVRAIILAILCAAALLVACASDSVEGELRSRLEGFFEATLNGDVVLLDDYISDGCTRKAAFLELVRAAPAFENAEVEVPDGAFSFDVEDRVAVAMRSRDSRPLLVNGEPLEDDPSNDVPLKFVPEGGVWRVENCGAYVSG